LTAPDGKLHNQIDYILIEVDNKVCVMSDLLGFGCDTDHSWWLHKLERDYQYVNKQQNNMMWRNLF
jgi:hypothetical protein